MMWAYMKATDGPPSKPYLVRKSDDDIQDWNVVRKSWQTNLDRNDAFLGLDVHYKTITESEANDIVQKFKNGSTSD